MLPCAITTGSFWPVDTRQSISILREIGILDVELTLQANEFRLGFDRSLQMPLYPELHQMVQKGALYIHSVHAPHMDAEHGHSLRAREDYLRHTVETAHSLGAQVIVVHPFHLFTSQEAASAYLRGDLSVVDQALLPGIRSLLDQAGTYGIVVSMENVKIWVDDEKDYFNEPDNVRRLITGLAHPMFGVTLDIVHAGPIGHLDTFLDRTGKDIVNLHLADIELPYGRVPVGEGIIDWPVLIPKIAQLPNLHQVTVELTQATPDEMIRTYKVLKDLWAG